ncbi:MAG: response regulator, partial [Defluviitaleaceae bacterium]|nr:response regulator [Defluviitaleaceae bacterium]
DIRLRYVFDMLAARTATIDGFFVLVGPDGEIIVHGNADYMLTPYQEARNLRNIYQGDMLMQSIQSGESFFYDHHTFGPVYFFSTPLSTVNWTLGAVIPTASAEAQITDYLLLVMFVLLAFFILFLIVSLVFAAKFFGSIKKKEAEAFELSQLLRENSPLSCIVFDDKFNPIDVNQATLKLHRLPDKNFYIERFFDICPEYQPGGMPTKQAYISGLKRGFEGNSEPFIWMHKAHDNGESIPVEVTLQRMETSKGAVLVCWARDMREYYKLMELQQIEQEANEMTQLILNSAPLCVTIWDDKGNLIDANDRTVEFFGVGKNEYENRFAELWVEIQPCGTSAIQKSKELTKQIIANGSMRYDWAYHMPNGEEVVFDVVGTRIERDGKTLVLEYYQDLREIRAAQEKEREAERFSRIIQDNSPILIETWDTDGNFVHVNKKMMEILGINSVEEFKADVWKFSPGHQPCGKTSEEKNTEMIAIAMEQGVAQCEYNYLLPNGELLPTDVTLALVEFQGKKLVIGYAQDLRQIKEATKRERELEVKLQEQQMNERVRVMFDAAPIIIEYWDKNFAPLDCNLTALKYYELENKEEYSSQLPIFFEMAHPNTLEWRANLSKIFEVGFGQFEFADYKPSGEIASLEVQAVCLKLENEDVIVTYAQDVTQIKENERERLQALEKQREAHELTSLLIESSPVFMEIWHDGQLVDCNEECVNLFGIENKSEFITRYDELSPPYQPCGTPSMDKAAELVQETMRKGYVSAPWMHRNVITGEEVPVEVIFVLLKPSDNRELIVGYNIDMRPIIKAQEEQKRSEIAEGANRAKSNFLARMSHEIRTPITAVMGISEIELQDPTLSPKTGEAFAKIYNSADSLLGIVNDILDLSKIESGKMELAHSEYKASHMILDISQIHLAFVGSKNIKFTVRVDEDLPTHLVGDVLRIVQIANNILSNAFKYTLEGAVDLSFSCRRQENDDNILLIIAIRDNGFGMNEEQLQDLSNEYTRYHEHNYRFIEGTGLGMPIVFNLAKLMDADIKIDSEVGVGTSVVITIPQKPASENVLGADTARRLEQLEESAKAKIMKLSTHAEPMPYGRVLIVDDVEANLFVAKGLMAFYDLNIETCDSGYTAIDKIEQGNIYDIIFMDYMMPGINGTQTMQRLREIGYTHPIVALTANAMIGQAEEFVKIGFDGFISKPIQTPNLHAVLLRFIKDKQPPEVIEAALVANANKPAPKIDINNFQRNPELLTELKAIFVKTHKTSISTIHQALDEGDIDTAHRLAHTIKSAAAMIYENALSEAAQKIELVLAKKQQPTHAQLSTLKTELDHVLHSIGEPTTTTPNTNTP